MVKYLLPLLVALPLFGKETLFIFPDQESDFFYTLGYRLHHGARSVLISTPRIDHDELSRRLIKELKRDTTITLIAQQLTPTSRHLVQYRGFDLYHYTKRSMEGSTIIVDHSYVCFLADSLSMSLQSHRSMGWCSDDPEAITLALNAFGLLRKHSVIYLR